MALYRIVLVGPALLGLSLAAAAQWHMVDASGAGDQDPAAPAATAEVRNPGGYRLQIQRDADNTVHGYFELGTAFDVFTDDGCPTLSVDGHRPINLFQHARSCTASGNRVAFTLGSIEDQQIESEVLVQLMNGNQLLLRYPLRDVGYRETRFTLSRSKQVLSELLGENVRPHGR